MINPVWGLRTSSKLTERSQRNKSETWKWTTPKQVKNRPKAKLPLFRDIQEDKDGTKQYIV